MSDWQVPEQIQTPGGGGGRFVQPKNWLEVKVGKQVVQQVRLRILGSPVAGLVGWTHDNKPLRARDAAGFPAGQRWRMGKDSKGQEREERPKEFWAMPVWEYGEAGSESGVKVWEVPQAGIRDALRALVPIKGAPTGYDVVVQRSGKGFDTKYSVTALDSSPIPTEALVAWQQVQAAGFDLEALFDGGDPFSPAGPEAASVADSGPPF